MYNNLNMQNNDHNICHLDVYNVYDFRDVRELRDVQFKLPGVTSCNKLVKVDIVDRVDMLSFNHLLACFE